MNWIENFKGIKNYNGWGCYEDPMTGVLTWYFFSPETTFQVMATPAWDGRQDTPIDYISEQTDYLNLGTLEQYTFDTFEQYANAIQPFLDKALVIYMNETISIHDIEE